MTAGNHIFLMIIVVMVCVVHIFCENSPSLWIPMDINGAANIKRMLQETCAIIAKRESKQLTEKEYKNLQKRYRNILTRGEKELPPIPPKQNGKRGKVAKSDAHNLWRDSKSMRAPCCSSPKFRMCHSQTTGQNVT